MIWRVAAHVFQRWFWHEVPDTNAANLGERNAILRSDGVLAVESRGHACQRTTARTPSLRRVLRDIVKFAAFTSNLLPLTSVLNPGTVGIAFGLPLFFLSAKLPAFVGTPVHLLAGLNTPLAMIVIGYGLAGAKLGRAARTPVLHVAAFIRLVAYPLLVVAAMYPFRQQLDRNMMLAITIAASAPVAAMVSMFATLFKRDVDTSVAVVSGTTLLSILTMPPVIALAMSVL